VEIFDILGRIPTTYGDLSEILHSQAADVTHVPVGPAKFDVNRCKELPLRGEKNKFDVNRCGAKNLICGL